MQLAVLSADGRDDMPSRTVFELEERGAAHVVASRTLFYSASTSSPAPAVPPGWRVVRRPGPRGGGADFRWMLDELEPGEAILFEDDLQPCRNAVPRMLELDVPEGCGARTYYSGGALNGIYTGRATGTHVLSAKGFRGSQAVRLPAWLLERLRAGHFDPPHVCQDVWLERVLEQLGLPIAVTCPSLVQHVGEDSLCSPGADLAGARAPSNNFPGEDFDALGPCGELVVPGPWTPRSRVTWCALHEMHHFPANFCPRR